MYRSFKVRLFPTSEQEELMWKHIHACRFVWNYMLDLQESRYSLNRSYLNGYQMQKEITLMKKTK